MLRSKDLDGVARRIWVKPRRSPYSPGPTLLRDQGGLHEVRVGAAVARQLDLVPARLGRDIDPECVGLIRVIDDAVDSMSNFIRIDDVETRVFVPIGFHGQQEPRSTGRDVVYIDRMD